MSAVLDDTLYVVVLENEIPGRRRYYAHMSNGHPLFRATATTRAVARMHKAPAETIARQLTAMGYPSRLERAP